MTSEPVTLEKRTITNGKTSLIAFLLAALTGLASWLIWGSIGFAAIVALTAFVAAIVWAVHEGSHSERSQGLAGFLSAIALLMGAYWYLVDRPGVPKIGLSIEGQGVTSGDGRALVFLSVDIANVGNSAIRFEGAQPVDRGTTPEETAGPSDVVWGEQDCAPLALDGESPAVIDNVMQVRLDKVAPVAGAMQSRLECATLADGSASTSLARADVWPPVAQIGEVLYTTIEAGESERYYFRALIPCEEGLVLSASVRIPKRNTVTDVLFGQRNDGMVWISQTLFDLKDACSEEGEGR